MVIFIFYKLRVYSYMTWGYKQRKCYLLDCLEQLCISAGPFAFLDKRQCFKNHSDKQKWDQRPKKTFLDVLPAKCLPEPVTMLWWHNKIESRILVPRAELNCADPSASASFHIYLYTCVQDSSKWTCRWGVLVLLIPLNRLCYSKQQYSRGS